MMGLAELAGYTTSQPGVHLCQGIRHRCQADLAPLAESSGALRFHRWSYGGAGTERRA